MLILFILAVTTFPDWDSKAESDLKIRKFSSSLDSWSPFWKESEKQLSKLAIHENPQQATALFTAKSSGLSPEDGKKEN